MHSPLTSGWLTVLSAQGIFIFIKKAVIDCEQIEPVEQTIINDSVAFPLGINRSVPGLRPRSAQADLQS